MHAYVLQDAADPQTGLHDYGIAVVVAATPDEAKARCIDTPETADWHPEIINVVPLASVTGARFIACYIE